MVRQLSDAGHRVRALVRPASDVSRLPAGVEVVRGELAAADAACSGATGLIHLAGISGDLLRRGDPGHELRRVNVEGTARLFAAARAAGVRRGVLITSMWTAVRPELAERSPYVRSRLESERAAIDAGGGSLRTVLLCPSFVVGAGDRGPNFPGTIVRAFARGRLPIAPPGGSMWIAVADAAAAICAALAQGEPDRRYVLGAEYLSYRDVGVAVGRVTGRRAPRVVPPEFVRTGAAIADRLLAAVGRHAPLPMTIGVELLCQPEPIDCAASWGAFGRPRTRVVDAIEQAVDWFRADPRAARARA